MHLLIHSLRRVGIGIVLGMAWLSMIAQDYRELTNSELNIQKLFIEANKEKLLGSYDEAASLYQEVLDQDPENDAAMYEIARVYEAKGERDRALGFIERAIRTSPDNEWYRVMKGDILESMQEYAAAVDVYEYLIGFNPGQSYYYEHLVGLLTRTNQLEEALSVLTRQEAVAGVMPDLIFQKVDILNELNRPEEGIVELQKLARLYPNQTVYLYRLAAQSMLAGKPADARGYYEQILVLDPDDGRARLALATEVKRSGDDLAYLQSISDLMANPAVELDAKIIELIPFVEKYAEDPGVDFGAELGRILQQLAAQYPKEAKTHAILGDYLYNSNDLFGAKREYEKTLALDKSVFAVWEQLMYLKLELGEYDGMLSTSEQALDVFPNQASIYYLRGLAFSRKQDYQSASSELQQALIMSGRNASLQKEVLLLLSKVYQESGQMDKAGDAYNKAFKLAPKDPDVLAAYSYFLASNGESLELAMEMAAKAHEITGPDYRIEHTLAWIAFQSGDLKSARTYIEQSMDNGGGDNYRVLEHYGDILMTMGETQSAVEHWQLSMDSGNPSEVLKRKIIERRMIH